MAVLISHGTCCPEDESNFEMYGYSGIGEDMRMFFGLLRGGMCGFNYMYISWGLLSKFLQAQ